MFKAASDSAHTEYRARLQLVNKPLKFGIDYLDDSLRGIFPDDLVLLGAPPGIGKTQFCCNLAYANLCDGKTVHYIALEAAQFEIERRLKWPLVMDAYYADENRPSLGKIEYTDWLMGKFGVEMEKYEMIAADYFASAYRGLHIYYKSDKFDVGDLIEAVGYCANKTDLIMIDHVHYFDYDDDNENRAIKKIAKTVRTLALEEQKPIFLVAHLRKRDRGNDELTAGLDEFHGSSDLYKIATRVITFSPGKMVEPGKYETYFRIAKNRLDGGVIRFIGREIFSAQKGGYEKGQYRIGWANSTRKDGFVEIEPGARPSWARESSACGGGAPAIPERTSPVFKPSRRPPNYAPVD